jgi:hypothetical protein
MLYATYYFARSEVFTAIKIEAGGTFETSVAIYKITRRHIPESVNINFTFRMVIN